MDVKDDNIPTKKRKLEELRQIKPPSQPFPSLPIEVWGYVLQSLDFNSIFNFSCCGRLFRFVATETLQMVNLFRVKVSSEILNLLKDAGCCILVLNLSYVPSLTAENILEICSTTMVNLVTLDISRTALTIPSFVRISHNFPKLRNLTMDFLYTEVREDNAFNKYKAAFAKLKFIHFHGHDWILANLFWKNSLSILEDALDLFELRFTLQHGNYDFINFNIDPWFRSTPRLTFRKLTISTVTVSQNVSAFMETNFHSKYILGSNFFQQFIRNNWQFVLFRASEQNLDNIRMSQKLFDNLKVYCKDIENQVTVNDGDFDELFSGLCILHMWDPTLFERNCHLSKEIAIEIEKKLPKQVQGHNVSVMGMRLTISIEEWYETEMQVADDVIAELIVIVENSITHNINLGNITTFIVGEVNSRGYGFRNIFEYLFSQCRNLETLILRCRRNDSVHIWAWNFLSLAKNLKTIQLSGCNIVFKNWLSELSQCKKLENVEIRWAYYNTHGLAPTVIILRDDLFRFIDQSKNLKCMLVSIQLFDLEDLERVPEMMQELRESFEAAIEEYKRPSLYFAVEELRRHAHVDAQCEAFYPVYSKFLKPLLNLKNK